MKTALLRQKELKEEENGREHSVNTLLGGPGGNKRHG